MCQAITFTGCFYQGKFYIRNPTINSLEVEVKDNQKIIIALVVTVLVMGGLSVFVFRGDKEGIENVTGTAETEVSLSREIDTGDTNVGTVPTVDDSPTKTLVVAEEGIVPTPRSGLESTDPSVVNLASGEIQLVEFFAYW
jgi:hypothetical protein